jgi:hypothetical protein
MTENQRSTGRPHRALYCGAATGIAIPVLLLGRDLIQRFRAWEQGGVGEGAIWGEPLFYMIVLGVPLAIVGATVGAAIDARLAQQPRPRE